MSYAFEDRRQHDRKHPPKFVFEISFYHPKKDRWYVMPGLRKKEVPWHVDQLRAEGNTKLKVTKYQKIQNDWIY